MYLTCIRYEILLTSFGGKHRLSVKRLCLLGTFHSLLYATAVDQKLMVNNGAPGSVLIFL